MNDLKVLACLGKTDPEAKFKVTATERLKFQTSPSYDVDRASFGGDVLIVEYVERSTNVLDDHENSSRIGYALEKLAHMLHHAKGLRLGAAQIYIVAQRELGEKIEIAPAEINEMIQREVTGARLQERTRRRRKARFQARKKARRK